MCYSSNKQRWFLALVTYGVFLLREVRRNILCNNLQQGRLRNNVTGAKTGACNKKQDNKQGVQKMMPIKELSVKGLLSPSVNNDKNKEMEIL